MFFFFPLLTLQCFDSFYIAFPCYVFLVFDTKVEILDVHQFFSAL